MSWRNWSWLCCSSRSLWSAFSPVNLPLYRRSLGLLLSSSDDRECVLQYLKVANGCLVSLLAGGWGGLSGVSLPPLQLWGSPQVAVYDCFHSHQHPPVGLQVAHFVVLVLELSVPAVSVSPCPSCFLPLSFHMLYLFVFLCEDVFQFCFCCSLFLLSVSSDSWLCIDAI